MKNKNDKFVERLKYELAKIDDVKSIILYGSSVSKKTNKNSDIDLIVFLRDCKYDTLIKDLSKKIYNLFLEYDPHLFPSVNFWKESDSKIILPYYLTCLDLQNIKIIYDKINFKDRLRIASKRLNKSYLRKDLTNDKKFWLDIRKESTNFISHFSLKKYNSLKKYADIALKNRDYDTVGELNYKSSSFLLTSFLEGKGIHIKGKNDSYFLPKLNKDKVLGPFLERYYVLLNIRKSSIPFNNNICRKLALDSKKIRIELEKIYNESLR